jgi:hypothetical protein
MLIGLALKEGLSMAKIVGVHGVGQQFKGEHMIRDEWLSPLKDGLLRTGSKLPSDSDFSCAFYGDLFRPSGKGMDPPYDATDVDDVWERELLGLWWQEAARVEPQVRGPDAQTKVIAFPGIVQRALDALSQSEFFAGLAERALIFDLKQVRRYLREPEIRRQARGRVEQAIGPDTHVVFGHSLGSVVAYEALCAHPRSVKVFVTLGSPLGIRNLIFDALDPSPADGKGAWPSGIEHWVNIADKGDVVALVKDLSSRFGADVIDRLVDNGAKAHDGTRYLTTREFGDALAIGI